MRILFAVPALALAVPFAAAHAEPVPASVAAMIDAAAGDPASLKTVADIAKKTNPGSAAEIDAQVAGYQELARPIHQTGSGGLAGVA